MKTKEIIQLYTWLLKGFDKQNFLALFLFILVGFFQGVGIVFLIPLLSLTGLKETRLENNHLIENARNFLNFFHIPITFESVLIIFVCIIFLTSYIRYQSSILNTSLSQKFSNELRKRLHKAIIEAEWITLVRVRSSDLIGMLSREINQVSFGITTLTQLTSSLVLLISNVIIAFLVSPQITFYVLLSGLFLIFFQQKLFRLSHKNGEKNLNLNKELQSNLQENFLSIKLAKSQNQNEQQINSLEKISDLIFKNHLHFAKIKSKADLTFNVISSILIAIYVYFILHFFKESILNLVLLFYVFSRIVPLIKSMGSNFQTLLNLSPVISDLKIKLTEFESHAESDSENTLEKIHFEKEIRITDLSYTYNNKKNVLENIHFSIPSKKVTTITGPSGMGKSTFADLLTALLKPSKGTIYVDDIPLSEIGYKNWRQHISYMTQERFLFHASIRENLQWSNPNASEDDLWKALQQAQASTYVKQLPDGIDTVVGDRGLRLSGGQRQRIALAMALVRKPLILILDEATNELDEFTEKEIYETIYKLKESTTIFVITHRLSTMKLSDNPLVFSKEGIKAWKDEANA